MKRIAALIIGMLFSFASLAAGPGAVRKTIESSMLLTGTLVVGAEGKVTEYAIDQPEKIASGVLDFVNSNVKQWEFEPTLLDGTPVPVRNKMNIRIVANEQENGDFTVRLGGASFLPFKVEEGSQVSSTKMSPPRYPDSAGRAGATGTAYLIVKVGRDGNVQEVVAEQVNLRFVASENVMQQTREAFARASIQAAKQWKFAPPVKGEDRDEPYWTVRVPVDYLMGSRKERKYGQWESYVPGPRHPIPWKSLQDSPGFSPDTMVAGGGVYQTGKGLRLLTPLSGG